MSPAWFDTHAHVCDSKFESDRDSVISTAFQNHIRGFIEIADGPPEWEKAKLLAHQYPGKIWWAAGVHPYFADQATEKTWNDLKNISKDVHFVAIGEVGLDYAKCPISPDVQKSTFISALDLALDLDKPLVIHCREAYADLLPILKTRFSQNPHNGSPGVIHCFSGNQSEAEQLVEMGFYLGVDGPLTYPKSDALREVFKNIRLGNIVIETDSPYLPPQPLRGQRNEPRYVSFVGLKLAELRHISPENLAESLLQNSQKLFRIKLIEN